MNHAGFTLFEVLVALLLGSIISLCSLKLVTSLSTAYYASLRESEHAAAIIRTELLLADSVAAQDTNPFPVGFRIHKRARISTPDGRANPVVQAPVLLRPLAGTDAVTSTSFETTQALKVLAVAEQGPNLRVTACPRWKPLDASTRIRNFLAVSPAGYFELTSLLPISKLAKCTELSLRSEPSLITRRPRPGDLSEVRVLIPIRYIHSLYVGRSGELRLLSHVGNRNIENQPILRGLKRLSLRAWITPGFPGVGVQASLGSRRKELISSSYVPRLGRQSPLNFLLNRP